MMTDDTQSLLSGALNQSSSPAGTQEPVASEMLALADEFEGEAKIHNAMGDKDEYIKCLRAAYALRKCAAPQPASVAHDATREALENCLGCVTAAEAEGLHEVIGELRGFSEQTDRLIDLVERRLMWVREYATPALASPVRADREGDGVAQQPTDCGIEIQSAHNRVKLTIDGLDIAIADPDHVRGKLLLKLKERLSARVRRDSGDILPRGRPNTKVIGNLTQGLK